MIHNQRIIWSDDLTEKDLSVSLSDFLTSEETIALVAADDYIFIGSDFPFNHKYFLVTSENAGASVVTVEYWDGSNWREMIDVIDRTASSGVTLAQSGIMQWRIDRDESGWACEDKSSDLDGLSKRGMYDLFWLRFTFSGDVTADIKYVGHLFSNDTELYNRYPDLNRANLKTAFAAGKTTWLDQHLTAAEEIIADLRRRNIIASSGQIMSHELFKTAAIHKTAELIFAGMGRSYDEDRKKARKYYDESMNMGGYFEVDKNATGDLSRGEKLYNSTGYMTR